MFLQRDCDAVIDAASALVSRLQASARRRWGWHPTSSADVLCNATNFGWVFTQGRLAVEDGRLAF